MENIINVVIEFLAAFIILFIMLFVLIAFLFTREKFPNTIKGFFLVIASLFYSPFIYFKNSLISISDFSLRGEKGEQGTKQFLLTRFLTALQALLAIIVIIVITSGLITAWEILLPPKYAREENARLKEELEKLQAEFDRLKPDVDKMEREWNNNKVQLINSYKNETETASNKAKNENTSIEQKLSGNSIANQYFFSIKNYLTQNEYQYKVSRYETIKNEAENYIERQDVGNEIKYSLKSYIQNWYTIMINNYEKNNFSDEQYRSKIQPEYSSKNSTVINLNHQIKNTQNQIDNLQPVLKYNFEKCFLTLLTTLLSIIVILWVIGLLLELLWLSVDIAGNINRLRNLKEINKSREVQNES